MKLNDIKGTSSNNRRKHLALKETNDLRGIDLGKQKLNKHLKKYKRQNMKTDDINIQKIKRFKRQVNPLNP